MAPHFLRLRLEHSSGAGRCCLGPVAQGGLNGEPQAEVEAEATDWAQSEVTEKEATRLGRLDRLGPTGHPPPSGVELGLHP